MDAAACGKEARVSSGHRSRFRLQGLLSLTLLLLAAGGSAAQAPAPPAGASSSEIAVTLVEIPVEVTSRGEPVQGLTAADFEVLEGKRSLPVTGFETVDLTAPPRQGAPRPPLAARRHVLFLFDFALSRPERLREGVTAARELVATGLDPRDLTAVGIYLPAGELRLLLSFTTDRAAASQALGALEGLLTGKEPAGTAGRPDPLRLTGLGARSLLSQAWRVNETNSAGEDPLRDFFLKDADERSGTLLQMNQISHSSGVHRTNVEARLRGDIITLSKALEGLSETLRPVSGRKYLALFSEGFSMDLAPHTAKNWDRPSVGGGDLLVNLRKTLGELRRSGWVLHAVDLGGVQREEMGGDGLFFMANETGGALVEGTNKLAEGLGGALRRSAHSYLLSVQTDVAPDGTFHPLEVRLRDKRRGVRVVYREGYYAPLPFSRQKDVQRLAEAAILVAGADERDDLGLQVAAVPLGTGAETTSVAVLVEIPGAPLLASGAPRLGVEVFGYALDEAGNSSDFFAQAVELERDKVGQRLTEGGVRVLARLDIPPGTHRLRVLARDRHNGRASLLTVPLSATSTLEAASTLEALFLPPANDPWVLVRSDEAAFDLHGRAVLPAVQATLAAAGEAQLLLLGRGLTGEGTWIKERILDAAGRPIEGGELRLQTITPGSSGQPDLVMALLQAGTLPPGRYLLELRAGRETRSQAVAVRPFEIVAQASHRPE
jgi:VWFA-related protein